MFGALKPDGGLDRGANLTFTPIAAFGTLLTAAYLLVVVRRVCMGEKATAQATEPLLADVQAYEFAAWTPLVALTVIAAPDQRDVYAWTSPAPDFRLGLDDGVRGMRVAYSPRLGYAKRVDPEIETAVKAAARTFEEADLAPHAEAFGAGASIGGHKREGHRCAAQKSLVRLRRSRIEKHHAHEDR